MAQRRWFPLVFLAFLLIPIFGLLYYALDNARQSFARIEFVEPHWGVIYSRKTFAVQIEEGTWASFRDDSSSQGSNGIGVWSIDRKGAAITLHRFPTLQKYSPVLINGSRTSTIVGKYGIFSDSSGWWCVDLTTNVVTDHQSVEPGDVPKMQVLDETSLLAVVGSTERLCKIFSIDDGKLVLQKEWSAVDVNVFGNPRKRSLLSLVQQGKAIQSRDTKTERWNGKSTFPILECRLFLVFKGFGVAMTEFSFRLNKRFGYPMESPSRSTKQLL